MAQNNIKDTTHLLVYGHEGWLEEYPSHYHLGDPIMVKMQWGHNLAVDGLPNKDYLKHRNENEENLLNYYLNAYLNPESFYETIEPCSISDSLQNLIKNFETKGVKMYCVSGMKFSFHLKAKENFVHKYYSNDIEVISARSQELKCDAVKIIKRINNCDLNEILFIDDNKENIIRFNNMGIHAWTPEEFEQLI